MTTGKASRSSKKGDARVIIGVSGGVAVNTPSAASGCRFDHMPVLSRPPVSTRGAPRIAWSLADQVECIRHEMNIQSSTTLEAAVHIASMQLHCCKDGSLRSRVASILTALSKSTGDCPHRAPLLTRSAAATTALEEHHRFLSTLPPVPCREDLGAFAERYFHSTGVAAEVLLRDLNCMISQLELPFWRSLYFCSI